MVGYRRSGTTSGCFGLTTVVDFVLAQRIEAMPLGDPRRKRWLALSLSCNLGLLGYFKYTNFGLTVMQDVAHLFGVAWVKPVLSIALPIGVSFYTFQSLSYTIDVYRGHLRAERNFLRFAVFVSFFPQLVAGPIVRSHHLLTAVPNPAVVGRGRRRFRSVEDPARPVQEGRVCRLHRGLLH